jgi:3-hydroxyisobutyrate dehydrogenase-like beta-hydroxyacid dehydrogenase
VNPNLIPLHQTKIETIGVLGAGQMGGGIAQVAAQISKKKVLLVDLNQAAVDRALSFMGASLEPTFFDSPLCFLCLSDLVSTLNYRFQHEKASCKGKA